MRVCNESPFGGKDSRSANSGSDNIEEEFRLAHRIMEVIHAMNDVRETAKEMGHTDRCCSAETESNAGFVVMKASNMTK